MMIVDTNVLIDVREDDPLWATWSYGVLADAKALGPIATSVVSIGELATRDGSLAELQEFCEALGIAILPLTTAAAVYAGGAQRAYRSAGGGREKLLADFLIGGAACAAHAPLATRDPRRFRAYFPDLTLITPETHP